MSPMPRAVWQQQAAETLAAIAAWREAHPRASWAELEATVDAAFGELRARVLADSAQASPAADPAPAERPRCPECGGAMHDAGRHRRQLTTEGEQPLLLERTYLRCSACGAGLFPPG